MGTSGRLKRVAVTSVVALFCAGLTATASVADDTHGVSGEAAETRADNLREIRTTSPRAPARTPVAGTPILPRKELTLRGKTKARSTKVTVQRWVATKKRWARVTRARSKRHAYRIKVTDRRALAARKLRVKPRKERAVIVRMTDSCGTRPMRANGKLWSCTLVDNFSGASLDRKVWTPQTVGFTTGDALNFACYRDRPDNVSVSGGALRLTLKGGAFERCEGLKGEPITRFTSGSVSSYRLFSQQYGRFEARTRNKMARVSGLHEAFWLWPDDRYTDTSQWPTSGEIDISETYSVHPTLAIPYLHYTQLGVIGPVLTGKHTNTAWNCGAARGVWNTWTLEWAPSRIDIFVNGRHCLTNTSGNHAFRKKYIVAFTQGIGGAQNLWTILTPMPATFEVDWVRVWK